MNTVPFSIGSLRIQAIPVTPFQQNCLLIWHAETKHGAVLDPGGDAERIWQIIRANNVIVEQIVLTHGHLDHIGGVATLRALLANAGMPLPINGPDRADEFLIQDLPSQGRMFGMDGLKSFTPDRWLREGDHIAIAGYDFNIRHCPGHTPGHIVFLQTDLKLALVGDVLFRQSIGRTDFPYGDHMALIAAIREKLLILPDDTQFICGHGESSTIGAERRSNPYLQG